MTFRRIFAALIAAALMILLSSCGKNKDEAAPEDNNGKKIVKLYGWNLSKDLKEQISIFNRRSTEHNIVITDYLIAHPSDPLIQLNIDIVSGNLPDILVIQTGMNLPVDSYISKGLFADIYDYIDNDPDVDRSDFAESVFRAYEVDGKLYEAAPTFNIYTLTAKTSLAGEKQGWTMDEFIDFVDSHPDKRIFREYQSKDSVLGRFIRYGYNEYIDRDTGECHFDSDEFIRLLEFCDRFPKEVDHSYLDDPDWVTKDDFDLLNGNIIFEDQFIYRFDNIRMFEHGYFGEPVTFKGYPGTGGNGSVIYTDCLFSVSSKSDNADGAWEFIKYLLSEEYQDQYSTSNAYDFPVRLSSLEKQAEACKERPYRNVGNGEKEYNDKVVYIGTNEIIIGENTDEDNRRIFDLINSSESAYGNNYYITNIVINEAAAYFEGQKSAKEVSEIIQNRVSNYIAENR